MEIPPSAIPIVDILKVNSTLSVKENERDWIEIGAQIDAALHSTGFVYLKNTGIPQEIVDAAFQSSTKFFNMTDNVKLKYGKQFAKTPTGYDYYSGFTPAGLELEGDADYEHKESYDLSGKKRVYPDEDAPHYRDAFGALETHLSQLTLRISKVLSVSLLGLEGSEFFAKAHSHLSDPRVENTTTLRALYYPPVEEETLKSHTQPTRCAAHTDYGFLTFLLMEPDAVGLEIKSSNGEWLAANPIPETVLMNVGDFLELWSDDRYPATFHRVQLPSVPELISKCRKSIAYFVNPDDVVTVTALETQFNRDQELRRKEVWNTFEHVLERSRNAYSATLESNT